MKADLNLRKRKNATHQHSLNYLNKVRRMFQNTHQYLLKYYAIFQISMVLMFQSGGVNKHRLVVELKVQNVSAFDG